MKACRSLSRRAGSVPRPQGVGAAGDEVRSVRKVLIMQKQARCGSRCGALRAPGPSLPALSNAAALRRGSWRSPSGMLASSPMVWYSAPMGRLSSAMRSSEVAKSEWRVRLPALSAKGAGPEVHAAFATQAAGEVGRCRPASAAAHRYRRQGEPANARARRAVPRCAACSGRWRGRRVPPGRCGPPSPGRYPRGWAGAAPMAAKRSA